MKLTDGQIVGMFVIAFPEIGYPAGRIKFTLNIDTTNSVGGYSWTNYNASDLELRDINTNETTWDFDDRENTMLLGQIECNIYDYQDNLGRMLTHPGLVKDNCSITFEYKKNGGSWVTEFEGIIDDESISNPPHSKSVSFSFSPSSETLNDSATFIGNTWNNLLGGGYSAGPSYWFQGVNVKTLITDIYKIINSSITVTFFNNWTFKSNVQDPTYNPYASVETSFDNLVVTYSWLFKELQQGNPNELKTYMQILKTLARSLGCFTGMISQDQAYFGLFVSFLNDSSEYTGITEKQIKKDGYKKVISERMIKYLHLPLVGDATTKPIEVGTNTGLDDDKIDLPIFNFPLTFGQGYIDSENGTIYLPDFGMGGDTDCVFIDEIKSPGIAYLPSNKFLAKYWGSYFLRPEIKRRDRIVFSGVDSSVNLKHEYNGIVYQWLNIKKDYKKDTTTIEEAIPIGTTASEETPGNTTQFTKMLKVPNFKILINGVEYTGGGNNIITGGGVFEFRWDNMYNIGSLSAEEFDGTILTIAQADTDVWKTIDYYVLYIFVSTANSAPASSYPTDNDANGTWYRYISIKDQKITNNSFVYTLKNRAINENTKFAFWLGAKSLDAKLFEGIGYYGGFLA